MNIDNLKTFFEKIKSVSLWQRLFGWRYIRRLSYDAFEEFTLISERMNLLNQEVSEKESILKDLQTNLNNATGRASEFKESIQKLENKTVQLENEIGRLNKEKTDLSNRIAKYEQSEEIRQEEFRKNIAAVNAIRESLEAERKKMIEERINEVEEMNEKRKMTWRNHEENVKLAIRNICKIHQIEYVEKVPFRGSPDNTIKIAGEFVVFDAKSPSGEDLDNFPRYLKQQIEGVKKYIKQENVKSEIFLVIPSNTVDVVNQYSYNMGDYNVYIITIDALEPVILALQKIENYEFAEQLTPEERENICRIIGKFSHTAKRKIQIDSFFSYQFLEILSKCGVDLPPDIYRSVQEFEKAEKLNPPQEKRARQILLDDLLDASEKLALEARAKLMGNSDNETNH